MATKIYGTSDDLIEFEGDIYDEIGPETGRTFVRRTAHLLRLLINKPFNPYGTLNRGCQTKAH